MWYNLTSSIARCFPAGNRENSANQAIYRENAWLPISIPHPCSRYVRAPRRTYMPAFIDLTGQHFGRLQVLSIVDYRYREYIWRCLCTCGNSTEVAGRSLRCGETQSCGCLRRDRCIELRTTHGGNGTTLHTRYWDMIARCEKPQAINYARYGGRGITVCPRWRASFEAFRDDMGDPPPGTQLERRNNDGPYSPENCYWATLAEQSRNRRSTHWLTYQGKTQTLTEWAHEVGLKKATLWRRICVAGWDVERALTTPNPRSKEA